MITQVVQATAVAQIGGTAREVVLVPDFDCWGWREVAGAGRYTGNRGRTVEDAITDLQRCYQTTDVVKMNPEWVKIDLATYDAMRAAGYRQGVVTIMRGNRKQKRPDLITAYAPALAEFQGGAR